MRADAAHTMEPLGNLTGMLAADATTPGAPETIDDEDIDVQGPARVILFNDEVHTFEEVIGQIIKATGCAQSKAEALTWQVHTTGKAMVFEGPMPECIRVSAVLEEIALSTQIEV